MMISVFILGLFLTAFVILINILLFQLWIKSAIKRIVKPALENNHLNYIGYKWVGFWGCGDFKYDKMDFALFKTGMNTSSIYSYLYYKDLQINKKSYFENIYSGFIN